MPPLLEPSTRLSRVVPQLDCFSTSTSLMPCFLKKPFSSATNSGAASVNAMKPSFALVVSGAPAARAGRAARPPISAALPSAVAWVRLRRVRRRLSCLSMVDSLPTKDQNENGVLPGPRCAQAGEDAVVLVPATSRRRADVGPTWQPQCTMRATQKAGLEVLCTPKAGPGCPAAVQQRPPREPKSRRQTNADREGGSREAENFSRRRGRCAPPGARTAASPPLAPT